MLYIIVVNKYTIVIYKKYVTIYYIYPPCGIVLQIYIV